MEASSLEDSNKNIAVEFKFHVEINVLDGERKPSNVQSVPKSSVISTFMINVVADVYRLGVSGSFWRLI